MTQELPDWQPLCPSKKHTGRQLYNSGYCADCGDFTTKPKPKEVPIDEKLYKWFLKNDVVSISPRIGMFISDVADEVKKKAEGEKDLEIRNELMEYATALKRVCLVAAIQDRAVIDKLAKLIKGGKP